MRDQFVTRIIAIAALLALAGGAGLGGSSPNTVHAAPPSNASAFTPMTPQRLVDTRTGVGGVGGRLTAEASVDVQVTGKLGIPDTASAVMINVTAVDSGGRGYLQVVPRGRAALRSSSTLNVDAPGQTIPNAAFAPIGDAGQITVFTTFATDLVIDVSGYFLPAQTAAAGRLQPLTPNRILDTRIALGWTPPSTTAPPTTAPTTTTTTQPTTTQPSTTVKPSNPGDTKNCSDFATYAAAKAYFDMYFPYYGDVAKLDNDNDGEPCESLPGGPGVRAIRSDVVAGSTIIPLQVAGRGGVPTDGVSAVVMNVTAVDPTGPGYVQVAPRPVTVGASSNLNVATGLTIANLVVVPLGAGGQVDLYTTTNMELLADVVGYFTSASASSSSTGLFVPITPSRQLDTRDPAGTQPVRASGTILQTDVSDVAANAIAIAGNATVTDSVQFGYLQVAAPPLNPGASSNVNVAYNGQTIANAVVSPVSGGAVSTFNNSPMHEILDVTGWFTQS